MLTQEQNEDLDYCKKILTSEIDAVINNSEPFKARLSSEILISIIYLKTFSSYIQKQQFDNINEAWKFMNDIKGIIEKAFYVKHYILRLQDSLKSPKNG